MRIGVVGCGYWGEKHVRVLGGLEEVDQVVAIEPDAARRAEVRRDHPSAVTVTDLAEALPLVDGVVVATPARTHAPIARAVLEAGRHVLVEKPMSMSTVDAMSLSALADEQGLTLMVGHTFEHHAAVRTLGAIVAGGQLGELRHLTSSRLNLGLFQPDISVLWDLAPHDVSILNFLLDDAPLAVSCRGWANVTDGVEDVAHLDLEYPGGVTAQVHVSWLHPYKVRQLTAVGASAMAVYDDLAADRPIQIHDKGVVDTDGGLARDVRYWDRDVRVPEVHGVEPLVAEDRHFVHCALNGERPLTDARNGLVVTATLEAAERSMRHHRPVELSEVVETAAALSNGTTVERVGQLVAGS